AGRFGPYGGRYVPETLIAPLRELEQTYREIAASPGFTRSLGRLLRDFAGRPTPLYRADNLAARYGRGTVYLKREDLCHTGAHKINNTLGQALLARESGKRRVIAETGAGQHGVATATVAALMKMSCVIYMGTEDMARQELNVQRMTLLGAEIVPVASGSATLKDATSEALRDWVSNVRDTFYILGSVVGPHPYPMIVRDFQSVIGREVRRQLVEAGEGLPDILVACVGGGSNAMGLFHDFLGEDVGLIAVEAAGLGISTRHHAASLSAGRPGVLHGSLGYLLQDSCGQVMPAHSISAGLDYPGVGPELSHLRDIGRVRCETADDREAVEAALMLTREEGILPALESAHAIAFLDRHMPSTEPGDIVVVGLSGRGDKDLRTLVASSKKGPAG
ncbi:MAG TPA: tryptophan synthase subunit beta, partial [Bacteroidota bacterium]|nr:tryptophan synthase subunit beta [Bacteroidota bacterium]